MGFTFNGIHSDTFGIGVNTESIPYIASKRQTIIEVQGRDGQYVFEDGYNNIQITLSCAIGDYEIQNRRKRAREIASWLSSTGKLVFDYEKDIEYMVVKTTNNISASVLGRKFKDEFTIIFECEPFQQVSDEVMETPKWSEAENEWKWTDISWNGYERVFSVTVGQTITVINVGTYKNLPIIILTGTASNAIIGGFSLKNLAGTVYVDCKNQIVYSIVGGNKVNRIYDFDGTFPEILPGINEFTIGGTITNLLIDFNYNHTYL